MFGAAWPAAVPVHAVQADQQPTTLHHRPVEGRSSVFSIRQALDFNKCMAQGFPEAVPEQVHRHRRNAMVNEHILQGLVAC